ncbi:MAG: metallophosphoesterase family protein [Thermoanaerobaculia bacterium]|nr:metallophosphoesterase family protein [Thermoanaerobaculia bacterium]
MAVALVADAHLGGPGGGGEELVEQIGELDSGACRLLLFLGDLFHVWVGDERYETAEVARVMPALDAARARGLDVRYVEGNRDFFLAGSSYARHFDAVAEEVTFTAADRRYLAVHGDGLDAADWRYRFWRAASKNPVSRFFCRRLPAGLARRFVHAMDRRLEDTNFSHKLRVPEEAVASYGARRLAEGFDVVLMGHYHQPRCWQLEAGEVRIVDAWFHHRRLEWLDD